MHNKYLDKKEKYIEIISHSTLCRSISYTTVTQSRVGNAVGRFQAMLYFFLFEKLYVRHRFFRLLLRPQSA